MDDIKRAYFLLLGIRSYDKYLQKNLKLHINDIKKVYSKIIFDSSIDENEVIRSLSAAFENHDRSKLKPANIYQKHYMFKSQSFFG
jgi:hypothetical protein